MTKKSSVSSELFEENEPERDNVLEIDEDDTVTVEVIEVPGFVVDETEGRTYENTLGHYFVAEDSDATDAIDTLIKNYASENSIISTFARSRGSAYEVIVEKRSDNDKPEQFRRQQVWFTLDQSNEDDESHFEYLEYFLRTISEEI